MEDHGHPGTPKGYSAPKHNLDNKFKSDGKGALEAMKRRIMGHYGDESKQSPKAPQKGHYPGSA